jgi:autotransporter-associated beta strand protein
LTKSGGAPLILNSANTYTGGTTIDEGGIVAAAVVGSLSTGSVTNNGILNLTAATGNADYSYTFGNLSGSGIVNVTLPPAGAKSTRINGTTNFTGVLNVGVNQVAGSGRLYPIAQFHLLSAPAIVNVNLNSTLLMDKAVTNTAAINLYGGTTGDALGQFRIENGVNWAGPVTLFANTTFGGNGTAAEISGAIGESGGSFGITRVGSGTTILSGSNTYSGSTWIKGGAISVPSINSVNAGAGTLGWPRNAAQGAIKLGDGTTGATLIYTGTGDTTDRIIDMAGSSGGATLDHAGTNALVFTGGMTISGTGNKTLTLQGSTIATGEFAGVISNGAGSVVSFYKAGTGTWTLSKTNTYTGSTTLNSGRLIVANPNALGTSLSVSITGSATLDFANDEGAGLYNYGFGLSSGSPSTIISGRATPGEAINRRLGASGIGNSSPLTFLKGANVTNGIPTFTIDSLNVSAGGAGTATLVPMTANLSIGDIAILSNSNPKTLQLDGASSDNTVTGVIYNGINTLSITKANTSTWTLFGTNTYTGATAITGGKLVLAGTDGSILGSSALSISGNGILELQGTALAGNTNRLRDAMAVSMNNGTFNFSHNGGDADYSEMAGALIITNSGNTVSASRADGGRTSVVSFASLTRNGNGMINFTGDGLGDVDERNKILFTNMVASTNFIGLWATYNTTNAAAYDVVRGIIAADASYSGFTNLTAKGPSTIPDNSALIARIIEEGSGGGISLEGVTTSSINGLVQNTIFEAIVAMPNQTLLASDIMMVAGTGFLTLGTTPNEGFLAPLVPSGLLQLINQSTNALTINAAITNVELDVVR